MAGSGQLDGLAFEAEVLAARRRRLAGKVAIVTGGAGGVGRGIGQTLAQAGARVLLADRDREGAERAAAELAADGAEVSGYGARPPSRASPTTSRGWRFTKGSRWGRGSST